MLNSTITQILGQALLTCTDTQRSAAWLSLLCCTAIDTIIQPGIGNGSRALNIAIVNMNRSFLAVEVLGVCSV